MFLSVVVPTHGRPDQLRKLLDSLARQTYPPDKFEVILVATQDDRAFAVAAELTAGGRLPIRCESIPGDPWNGRSAAAKRNYGVAIARGEWIAFVDDDCVADTGWLAGAAALLSQPGVVAVEGAKVIPPPDRPTLTYKGSLSFTRPGGYQTCNMFYRRDVFQELGGFDLRFPFYLEDSDFAWSVLDAGHSIPFAADARVAHPVSEPAPWRLLDDAKRVILLPLLRSKHPEQYRRSPCRAVRPVHAVYLVLYAGTIAMALAGWWAAVVASAGAVLGAICVHAAWLFWGCRVRPNEFWVTVLLLPVVPPVRLVQYLRGCWIHRQAALR